MNVGYLILWRMVIFPILKMLTIINLRAVKLVFWSDCVFVESSPVDHLRSGSSNYNVCEILM